MEWKYLRESKNKYFDEARNTTLKEYLDFLFPDKFFIYDKTIPKDIILSRDPNASYRRYRPDARCEDLNMIIEYDGLDHYTNQGIVLSDKNRDIWFQNLNYTIIRIPYWIQLSSEMVKHLFDIQSPEKMCTLEYSFFENGRNDSGLSTSVGAMSEAGRRRFLLSVSEYPLSEQRKVYRDLQKCIQECKYSSEFILPDYIFKQWLQLTPELIKNEH